MRSGRDRASTSTLGVCVTHLEVRMPARAKLIGRVHAYASGCGAAADARQASRSQSPPPRIPAAHTRKGRVLHASGLHRQGHTGCPAARGDGYRWDVPCPAAGNMLSHPAALQTPGARDGTCYRIRLRFRLPGLATVEPRRGRMPFLFADKIRAMRAWCEKPGGLWTLECVRPSILVRPSRLPHQPRTISRGGLGCLDRLPAERGPGTG